MQNLICGIDIGGTKLSTALYTSDGVPVDHCIDCDHVDKAEQELVGQVTENVRMLLRRNGMEESGLLGIGIGCAGHIRYRDGVIITTSNLKGYKNYPLRDAVQANFKVPVFLDNDANAQAFGEFKFGKGKEYDDMVFLTISTGIGAGIILNKRIYRGMTGTAGEFGHTILEPGSGLSCTCGNRGCLMAVACGMALPQLFKKKLAEGKVSRLESNGGFELSKIDGKLLKKGLDMDDPVSKEVIYDSGKYVGMGIYNIFQVLNPPLIVLGGGLMSWGDFYIDTIKTTFFEYARDMIFDPIEIAVSDIGAEAGVIGAASLVLESPVPES